MFDKELMTRCILTNSVCEFQLLSIDWVALIPKMHLPRSCSGGKEKSGYLHFPLSYNPFSFSFPSHLLSCPLDHQDQEDSLQLLHFLYIMSVAV